MRRRSEPSVLGINNPWTHKSTSNAHHQLRKRFSRPMPDRPLATATANFVLSFRSDESSPQRHDAQRVQGTRGCIPRTWCPALGTALPRNASGFGGGGGGADVGGPGLGSGLAGGRGGTW